MTDIDAGMKAVEAGTYTLAVEVVHATAGPVYVQLADVGGYAVDHSLYC